MESKQSSQYRPRKLTATVNFLGRKPVTITFRDKFGKEFAQCDVTKILKKRHKFKENVRDHYICVFGWKGRKIVRISMRLRKPRKLTKKEYEKINREINESIKAVFPNELIED
jgi:hypothetical protein